MVVFNMDTSEDIKESSMNEMMNEILSSISFEAVGSESSIYEQPDSKENSKDKLSEEGFEYTTVSLSNNLDNETCLFIDNLFNSSINREDDVKTTIPSGDNVKILTPQSADTNLRPNVNSSKSKNVSVSIPSKSPPKHKYESNSETSGIKRSVIHKPDFPRRFSKESICMKDSNKESSQKTAILISTEELIKESLKKNAEKFQVKFLKNQNNSRSFKRIKKKKNKLLKILGKNIPVNHKTNFDSQLNDIYKCLKAKETVKPLVQEHDKNVKVDGSPLFKKDKNAEQKFSKESAPKEKRSDNIKKPSHHQKKNNHDKKNEKTKSKDAKLKIKEKDLFHSKKTSKKHDLVKSKNGSGTVRADSSKRIPRMLSAEKIAARKSIFGNDKVISSSKENQSGVNKDNVRSSNCTIKSFTPRISKTKTGETNEVRAEKINHKTENEASNGKGDNSGKNETRNLSEETDYRKDKCKSKLISDNFNYEKKENILGDQYQDKSNVKVKDSDGDKDDHKSNNTLTSSESLKPKEISSTTESKFNEEVLVTLDKSGELIKEDDLAIVLNSVIDEQKKINCNSDKPPNRSETDLNKIPADEGFDSIDNTTKEALRSMPCLDDLTDDNYFSYNPIGNIGATSTVDNSPEEISKQNINDDMAKQRITVKSVTEINHNEIAQKLTTVEVVPNFNNANPLTIDKSFINEISTPESVATSKPPPSYSEVMASRQNLIDITINDLLASNDFGRKNWHSGQGQMTAQKTNDALMTSSLQISQSLNAALSTTTFQSSATPLTPSTSKDGPYSANPMAVPTASGYGVVSAGPTSATIQPPHTSKATPPAFTYRVLPSSTAVPHATTYNVVSTGATSAVPHRGVPSSVLQPAANSSLATSNFACSRVSDGMAPPAASTRSAIPTDPYKAVLPGSTFRGVTTSTTARAVPPVSHSSAISINRPTIVSSTSLPSNIWIDRMAPCVATLPSAAAPQPSTAATQSPGITPQPSTAETQPSRIAPQSTRIASQPSSVVPQTSNTAAPQSSIAAFQLPTFAQVSPQQRLGSSLRYPGMMPPRGYVGHSAHTNSLHAFNQHCQQKSPQDNQGPNELSYLRHPVSVGGIQTPSENNRYSLIRSGKIFYPENGSLSNEVNVPIRSDGIKSRGIRGRRMSGGSPNVNPHSNFNVKTVERTVPEQPNVYINKSYSTINNNSSLSNAPKSQSFMDSNLPSSNVVSQPPRTSPQGNTAVPNQMSCITQRSCTDQGHLTKTIQPHSRLQKPSNFQAHSLYVNREASVHDESVSDASSKQEVTSVNELSCAATHYNLNNERTHLKNNKSEVIKPSRPNGLTQKRKSVIELDSLADREQSDTQLPQLNSRCKKPADGSDRIYANMEVTKKQNSHEPVSCFPQLPHVSITPRSGEQRLLKLSSPPSKNAIKNPPLKGNPLFRVARESSQEVTPNAEKNPSVSRELSVTSKKPNLISTRTHQEPLLNNVQHTNSNKELLLPGSVSHSYHNQVTEKSLSGSAHLNLEARESQPKKTGVPWSIKTVHPHADPEQLSLSHTKEVNNARQKQNNSYKKQSLMAEKVSSVPTAYVRTIERQPYSKNTPQILKTNNLKEVSSKPQLNTEEPLVSSDKTNKNIGVTNDKSNHLSVDASHESNTPIVACQNANPGENICPPEWIEDIDMAAKVYAGYKLIEPFAVFEQRFIASLAERRKKRFRIGSNKKSSNVIDTVDLTNTPDFLSNSLDIFEVSEDISNSCNVNADKCISHENNIIILDDLPNDSEANTTLQTRNQGGSIEFCRGLNKGNNEVIEIHNLIDSDDDTAHDEQFSMTHHGSTGFCKHTNIASNEETNGSTGTKIYNLIDSDDEAVPDEKLEKSSGNCTYNKVSEAPAEDSFTIEPSNQSNDKAHTKIVQNIEVSKEPRPCVISKKKEIDKCRIYEEIKMKKNAYYKKLEAEKAAKKTDIKHSDESPNHDKVSNTAFQKSEQQISTKCINLDLSTKTKVKTVKATTFDQESNSSINNCSFISNEGKSDIQQIKEPHGEKKETSKNNNTSDSLHVCKQQSNNTSHDQNIIKSSLGFNEKVPSEGPSFITDLPSNDEKAHQLHLHNNPSSKICDTKGFNEKAPTEESSNAIGKNSLLHLHNKASLDIVNTTGCNEKMNFKETTNWDKNIGPHLIEENPSFNSPNSSGLKKMVPSEDTSSTLYLHNNSNNKPFSLKHLNINQTCNSSNHSSKLNKNVLSNESLSFKDLPDNSDKSRFDSGDCFPYIIIHNEEINKLAKKDKPCDQRPVSHNPGDKSELTHKIDSKSKEINSTPKMLNSVFSSNKKKQEDLVVVKELSETSLKIKIINPSSRLQSPSKVGKFQSDLDESSSSIKDKIKLKIGYNLVTMPPLKKCFVSLEKITKKLLRKHNVDEEDIKKVFPRAPSNNNVKDSKVKKIETSNSSSKHKIKDMCLEKSSKFKRTCGSEERQICKKKKDSSCSPLPLHSSTSSCSSSYKDLIKLKHILLGTDKDDKSTSKSPSSNDSFREKIIDKNLDSGKIIKKRKISNEREIAVYSEINKSISKSKPDSSRIDCKRDKNDTSGVAFSFKSSTSKHKIFKKIRKNSDFANQVKKAKKIEDSEISIANVTVNSDQTNPIQKPFMPSKSALDQTNSMKLTDNIKKDSHTFKKMRYDFDKSNNFGHNVTSTKSVPVEEEYSKSSFVISEPVISFIGQNKNITSSRLTPKIESPVKNNSDKKNFRDVPNSSTSNLGVQFRRFSATESQFKSQASVNGQPCYKNLVKERRKSENDKEFSIMVQIDRHRVADGLSGRISNGSSNEQHILPQSKAHDNNSTFFKDLNKTKIRQNL